MKAAWKENKKLKPEIILEKIESFSSLKDNGVSFQGYEPYSAFPALETMIVFPISIDELVRDSLLRKSVGIALKRNNLNSKNSFIQILNEQIKKHLKTKENIYHVLTSLSLTEPYPNRIITLDSVKIRLLKNGYPKKYIGRDKLIEERVKDFKSTLNLYTDVIITTKAKTPAIAVTKCIRALDIIRAIWSFGANSTMELLGGEQGVPINKIKLGLAHTIHINNGQLADRGYWFDSNFGIVAPYIFHSIEGFRRQFSRHLNQLEKSNYSEKLKDALQRYVRALDEKDSSTAFIKLWGAIESLVSPSRANYDLVTSRCSFLYPESDYHKQVLEHLREKRNKNVHHNELSIKSKIHCYQLQGYFRSLIEFHLELVDEFKTLDDANKFLDLPTKLIDLKKKRLIVEGAIKFRSGPIS